MKTFMTASILLFTVFFAFAQKESKQLIDSYEQYAKLPREVAYVHTNKTKYIKGENLAFNAYILDKSNHKFSIETTNLYCQILDENSKVVESKLIMINAGVGNGQFTLDTLYTPGNYTLVAYTNWMRNFNEQNFYEQNFKVIDPASNLGSVKYLESTKSSMQLLPEGGHLLTGVFNNVGVTLKDSLGRGIAITNGKIVDEKNQTITSFATNQFGIGKFSINPKSNTKYMALYTIDGKHFEQPMESAENNGIIMQLQRIKDQVIIKYSSNKVIEPENTFSLVIHNGSEVKITEVTFENEKEVLKVIRNKDLFSGINILTLFNKDNQPLLERLFFNYDGLEFSGFQNTSVRKIDDSIRIQLKLKNPNPELLNNFSVSVLPSTTKSYEQQHSLASQILLQPYLRGIIENGKYYFQDINPRKKYDLDNLLLTQGWSSYDWKDIFQNVPESRYGFEKGIEAQVTVNNNAVEQYLVYPLAASSSEIISLEPNSNKFTKENLFPVNDEKLFIAGIGKNGDTKKAKLYANFYPFKIPDIQIEPRKIQFPKNNTVMRMDTSFVPFQKTELLEEILLEDKKKQDRKEKLRNENFGTVLVFDEEMRKRYIYFSQYISQQGFSANEDFSQGTLRLANRNPVSIQAGSTPMVYLNNMLLSDLDLLFQFPMKNIDYIVINKNGLGGGMRGGAGIIKIYTDPLLDIKMKEASYSDFDFPLSFSVTKRFYNPTYTSYQTDFFKEYGTIDWHPNLNLDATGELEFKFYDNGISNIKIFVEGLTNDGKFVSEALEMKVN